MSMIEWREKHEKREGAKARKGESLIYPSPMATPWVHEMQKPVCALKRQHTYMTSNDVLRQNQSFFDIPCCLHGEISFREFDCYPEHSCAAGRNISTPTCHAERSRSISTMDEMLRFRYAPLRMTTLEWAVSLSCLRAFAPFYH